MTSETQQTRLRQIRPPDRVGVLGTAITLLLTGLFAAQFFVPARFQLAMVLLVAALSGVALLRRLAQPALLGLFFLLALAGLRFVRLEWPLPFAAALLVYFPCARWLPGVRDHVTWFRRGELNRRVVGLIVGSTLLSSLALLGWYLLLTPDVSDLRANVPNWPVAALIGAGIGFSLLNAAVEEAMYRGVMMQALDAAVGAGWLSIGLQAVAFGLLHINGFPRGWVGVGLAMIYGLMMGVIRREAKGMLAPWIGHILTDVVIICILVGMV